MGLGPKALATSTMFFPQKSCQNPPVLCLIVTNETKLLRPCSKHRGDGVLTWKKWRKQQPNAQLRRSACKFLWPLAYIAVSKLLEVWPPTSSNQAIWSGMVTFECFEAGCTLHLYHLYPFAFNLDLPLWCTGYCWAVAEVGIWHSAVQSSLWHNIGPMLVGKICSMSE